MRCNSDTIRWDLELKSTLRLLQRVNIKTKSSLFFAYLERLRDDAGFALFQPRVQSVQQPLNQLDRVGLRNELEL